MALLKEIELENGVIVKYHRIVSINKITNNQTIVEVASYTTEEKREEEKEAIKNGTSMNVFIDTNYYNFDYNENDNIQDYYNKLKELDKFKDAEDI